MRTLIALSLFQAGVLLVILFRLPGDAPSQVNAVSPSSPVPAEAPVSSRPGVAARNVVANAATSTEIREIVRDELRQALAETGDLRAVNSADRVPVDPGHRHLVYDQIEYFRGAGEISPQEMSDLMSNIAQLDPASRREALSRLTRAMNNKEIDGRF